MPLPGSGSEFITDTAAAGVDVSRVSVDKNESSGVGHILLEVDRKSVV